MRVLNRKTLFGTCTVLAIGILSAQQLRVAHFEGLINDYTPSTVAGGPYEMRGTWSLDVQPGDIGSFAADLNMETSDYGVSSPTAVDPANPATRGQHTHHISLTNAAVTYDTSVCPVFSPPATGSGIVLTSTAKTTGNGGPAPFEANGPSALQVCVTGGTQVNYSNLTIVYSGPAAGHFGTQAIHGVVTKVSSK